MIIGVSGEVVILCNILNRWITLQTNLGKSRTILPPEIWRECSQPSEDYLGILSLSNVQYLLTVKDLDWPWFVWPSRGCTAFVKRIQVPCMEP